MLAGTFCWEAFLRELFLGCVCSTDDLEVEVAAVVYLCAGMGATPGKVEGPTSGLVSWASFSHTGSHITFVNFHQVSRFMRALEERNVSCCNAYGILQASSFIFIFFEDAVTPKIKTKIYLSLKFSITLLISLQIRLFKENYRATSESF